MKNWDPNATASFITLLGGEVIPGDSFRFDLPMSEVKAVVPKINQTLGNDIGVRRVAERRDQHPTKHEIRSVVTLELYRRSPDERAGVETSLLSAMADRETR
jgi:hypothetical protein